MSAARLQLASGPWRGAVEVHTAGDEYVIRAGAREVRVRLVELDTGRVHATVDGRRLVLFCARQGEAVQLHFAGRVYTFRQARDEPQAPVVSAEGDVRAPMPGVVTRVLVQPGDQVHPGQPLYVLEAMKVETVVRAPRAARVRRVLAAAGEQVEGGATVVELEVER
ncbi:MAG: biotin/lipoyl-containing protein [Armatimonadota bacterium]|nr:biotin/lipoyl-binding protein [Armatimonadota bacterium]MDW8156843.1 biotin/lipoyl-containing protein [Armatimonadota bacterium]